MHYQNPKLPCIHRGRALLAWENNYSNEKLTLNFAITSFFPRNVDPSNVIKQSSYFGRKRDHFNAQIHLLTQKPSCYNMFFAGLFTHVEVSNLDAVIVEMLVVKLHELAAYLFPQRFVSHVSISNTATQHFTCIISQHACARPQKQTFPLCGVNASWNLSKSTVNTTG